MCRHSVGNPAAVDMLAWRSPQRPDHDVASNEGPPRPPPLVPFGRGSRFHCLPVRRQQSTDRGCLHRDSRVGLAVRGHRAGARNWRVRPRVAQRQYRRIRSLRHRQQSVNWRCRVGYGRLGLAARRLAADPPTGATGIRTARPLNSCKRWLVSAAVQPTPQLPRHSMPTHHRSF